MPNRSQIDGKSTKTYPTKGHDVLLLMTKNRFELVLILGRDW